MNSTIEIQNLPEGVNTENRSTSKAHQFKIDTTTTPSNNDTSQEANVSRNLKKSCYVALRNALEEAKNEIGSELRAWRDCVGKKELNKEPRKGDGDEEEEVEGWFQYVRILEKSVAVSKKLEVFEIVKPPHFI